MSLQKAKGKLFVSYIALAVLSTLGGYFIPYKDAKPMATSAVVFSIIGLFTTELSFGSGETQIDKLEKKLKENKYEWESEVRKLEAKSNGIQSKLNAELANVKSEDEIKINSLQDKIKFVQSQLNDNKQLNKNLAKKLEKTQQELSEARLNLSKAYNYNSSAIHEIIRKAYNRQVKNVESLIDGFLRFYPQHRDSFNAITTDIEKFKTRYEQKIKEYEKVVDIEDLLDIGLELQEKIIELSAKYRLKAQQIVIAHLKQTNKDSIRFSQHDELLSQAVEKAIGDCDQEHELEINELTEIKSKLEGDIKALCHEWIAFSNKTVEDYNTEYTEILDHLKVAAYKIEEFQKILIDSQEKINELRLPHMFPGEIEKSHIGNVIIAYYWNNYNVCLDCAYWIDNELGYILYFYVGRNEGALITPDILNDGDLPYALQNLTQSLEMPKFQLDTDKGCMRLEIVKRRKTKTEKEITLPKSVKTTDKFAETVAKWERVRITGGSESGKSPTAENVAICILKARNSGLISFYDPMHDSVKNYRSVPPTGASHGDSIKGLKEFADLMQNPPNQDFQLVWFDEIDSTMDESPSCSKYLKAIFKQASHKNLGLIVTGQNSNVTAISGKPPIQRSDMKNMVIVHIGSNYEDGLANSNLPESEKKKLGDIGLRVTEWCEYQNNLEGLEATGKSADVNAYRFALVLEPQKRGYFMLLPEFGKYTFEDIDDTDCPGESELLQKIPTRTNKGINYNQTTKTQFQVDEIPSKHSEIPSTCPKCDSTTITEIEGYKDGRRKFRCGRGHKFGIEENQVN